jgi:uncharacterized Zn finger protein
MIDIDKPDSCCPRCAYKMLERVIGELPDDETPVYFIQCRDCGAVAGVYYAPGKLIHGIEEKIKSLLR